MARMDSRPVPGVTLAPDSWVPDWARHDQEEDPDRRFVDPTPRLQPPRSVWESIFGGPR